MRYICPEVTVSDMITLEAQKALIQLLLLFGQTLTAETGNKSCYSSPFFCATS